MPCSRTHHGLTRVGLEPRPLDPESEALTIRPPRSLKLVLSIHVNDISLYINCVFYSGRIRTLVAMTIVPIDL